MEDHTIDQREADVRKLCRAIIATGTSFWDNPNGPYESSCPFCSGVIKYGGNETTPTMSDIKHDADCAWLIAKDLMTNID